MFDRVPQRIVGQAMLGPSFRHATSHSTRMLRFGIVQALREPIVGENVIEQTLDTICAASLSDGPGNPVAYAPGWLAVPQTLVVSEEGHIAFLRMRDNRKMGSAEGHDWIVSRK